MVVDAVIAIGNDDRLNMIGIKKVCDFNMKTWFLYVQFYIHFDVEKLSEVTTTSFLKWVYRTNWDNSGGVLSIFLVTLALWIGIVWIGVALIM